MFRRRLLWTYWSICLSIHIVALCPCIGCILNPGAIIHSSGTYRVLTRKKQAILCLVQVHMLLTSVHVVYLCSSVSVCWQSLHVSLSSKLMACSRWLVGIMSCIMTYHVVWICRGRTFVLIFVHTLGHCICGCLVCTLGTNSECPAQYLWNCIAYMLFSLCRSESCCCCPDVYTLSWK
jgi:hypothetical protein